MVLFPFPFLAGLQLRSPTIASRGTPTHLPSSSSTTGSPEYSCAAKKASTSRPAAGLRQLHASSAGAPLLVQAGRLKYPFEVFIKDESS
ncbi:hypothetical protein U9M48_014470 [Paspalum notatum var. saurae]|uniref:Uncharacterized protein n=1 Tax=Paspalum notatum var. saurae TaxID=547442 RepID=A0AAQ3WKT7_PASNO